MESNVVPDESASVCLHRRPPRVLEGKKSNFAWPHSRPDLQFSFLLVHHSPINSQTTISFEQLDLSDHDRKQRTQSALSVSHRPLMVKLLASSRSTASHRYDATALAKYTHYLTSSLKAINKRGGSSEADIRDAILVQCVQRSVAVLGGGALVHVPEALHGRDVPLDTLLGEVEFGHEGQRPAVITTEKHGATVVALKMHLAEVKNAAVSFAVA